MGTQDELHVLKNELFDLTKDNKVRIDDLQRDMGMVTGYLQRVSIASAHFDSLQSKADVAPSSLVQLPARPSERILPPLSGGPNIKNDNYICSSSEQTQRC